MKRVVPLVFVVMMLLLTACSNGNKDDIVSHDDINISSDACVSNNFDLTSENFDDYTDGQANAVKQLEYYIENYHYSKQKLVETLKPGTGIYGDFTQEDIDFAIENCTVDWYEQAMLAAESWFKSSNPCSYESMVTILVEYKLFTQEQAEIGAQKIDWNDQALKYAKNYVDMHSVSYKGLLSALERDKFTPEQATFAADNCGADWKHEALEISPDLIKRGASTYDKLIDLLTDSGFTDEEAKYAADNSKFK